MSKKKTNKISTLGSQVASTISVALVLLILGVLASIGLAAEKVTASVLGQVAIIVKVDPMASEADVQALNHYFTNAAFSSSCQFTSAQQVLEQEMEQNQEILDLIGENPYSPEFEIRLAPDYVHPDSINDLTNRLSLINNIEEVLSQTDTVRAVTKTAANASLILICVAVVLLVISIVLIFNTVSIAVYGRRFVIRTMQLVGATASFIRRPFIMAAVASGIIAGLIASGLLIAAQLYLSALSLDFAMTLSWEEISVICVAITVIGVIICSLSAFCATHRYLNASYDNLYS